MSINIFREVILYFIMRFFSQLTHYATGFGNSYNPVNVSPEVLRVDFVDFYPEQNAKDSRTFDYELARDQDQPTPVLRRAEPFRLTFVRIVFQNIQNFISS